MPILKASIKSERQSIERQKRRQPYKTNVKTYMKKVLDLAKHGKTEEAVKILPKAVKAIDMACKRDILHWKNAARKKSLLARSIASRKPS